MEARPAGGASRHYCCCCPGCCDDGTPAGESSCLSVNSTFDISFRNADAPDATDRAKMCCKYIDNPCEEVSAAPWLRTNKLGHSNLLARPLKGWDWRRKSFSFFRKNVPAGQARYFFHIQQSKEETWRNSGMPWRTPVRIFCMSGERLARSNQDAVRSSHPLC